VGEAAGHDDDSLHYPWGGGGVMLVEAVTGRAVSGLLGGRVPEHGTAP
jgi:hypothetical protein